MRVSTGVSASQAAAASSAFSAGVMAEAFSRAVLDEVPLAYGLDDARANMRIIDALFRSEMSGSWEALA